MDNIDKISAIQQSMLEIAETIKTVDKSNMSMAQKISFIQLLGNLGRVEKNLLEIYLGYIG